MAKYGKRGCLKSICPKGLAGSSPALGTESPNVSTARKNSDMYSRAIVDTALVLSSAGVLDRENAQICGVSVKAIRYWRTGRRRAANYDRRSAPLCPRCYRTTINERAYAYLLGLYLGDGHITRGRRDVYALWLYCCDDWPGLMTAASEAMSAVMPASKVFRVQRTGCTAVKSTSKHRPCLFPQHGPGLKHTREIRLEPWQQAIVDAFPADFVRGLFHSDGCRCINRVRATLRSGSRWYEYPRYFFSNKSLDILGLCGATLDQLGVSWRLSRPDTISVARREAVARLDEFVGPKH
jgi:hypothetical protein